MSKFIRIINADQVVEVKITDQTKSPYYTFQPAIKRRFLPDQKEGFIWGPSLLTAEEVQKNEAYTVIDNTVFVRPSVRVQYSDRKESNHYFDSYDLAIAFSRTITNNIQNKVVIDQAQ